MFAYLLLRLVPSLKLAPHSLARLSWKRVVGAIGLQVVSELGFVFRLSIWPSAPAHASTELGGLHHPTTGPGLGILVGRRDYGVAMLFAGDTR